MKIYTKTGDDGQTMLFGGGRVPKYHQRIEAYGTVDELNSFLGLIRDQAVDQKSKTLLKSIQENLFVLGSILATNPEKKNAVPPSINEDMITELENAIDEMELDLPPLERFVLPGGNVVASYAHLARTVCRRAERRTIELAVSESGTVPDLVIHYLNRLSDFLFVFSRKMVYHFNAEEIEWSPKKN